MNVPAINQLYSKALQNTAPWVLGIVAVLICIWRIRYIHEPLENDITIRMGYAALALVGNHYYTDLYVFGPPGSLWINELFAALFGTTEFSIYFMGCAFSVLTLLGIYRCTHLLSSSIEAGLVAAITWAFINADLFTQANQPNSEVFINAAIVWAFVFIFDQRQRHLRLRLVAAGLLFFLASTIKHFIAIVPILAALVSVFLPHRQVDGWQLRSDKATVSIWVKVGLVAVLAWVILVGWYVITDRFMPLMNGLFGDSLGYASGGQGITGIVRNFLTGIRPNYLLPPHQRFFFFLYLALIFSVSTGISGLFDSRWKMMLGWVIGTWFSVSLSGAFFPHYYMLWMPLISIGTGTLYGFAMTLSSHRLSVGIRAVILGVIFFVGLRQVAQLSQYDAARAVVAKYPLSHLGEIFSETREVGFKLAREISTNNTLFELGASGVYFYTGRLPQKPYVDSLYCYQTGFFRCRATMLPVLLRKPPDFLIIRQSLLDENLSDSPALLLVLKDLLKEVKYVERKDLRGDYLTVLERQPLPVDK